LPAAKICRTCKAPKAYTEYARHNTSRDKHRHDCRPCVAAARKNHGQSRKPKAVAQKPALPAAPYTPSPVEQAVVDRFHEQRRAHPEPGLRIKTEGHVSLISPDHPDANTGTVLLMSSIGIINGDFFKGLMVQLAELKPGDEKDLN